MPPTTVHGFALSASQTPPSLPDGDILLHAGDLAQSGSVEKLNAQTEWLDA